MDQKITFDQLKHSIESSGYLIEQRIEPILTKAGFIVEKNPVYKDDETGKTREIDLSAFDLMHIKRVDDFDFLNFELAIECENNKQPVVFFRNDSELKFLFYLDIKYCGMPPRVILGKNKSIKIPEYLNFGSFHHYCKGYHSTQYCTFQPQKRDKDNQWIALHLDAQHDSIRSLIKCIKYFLERDIENFSPPQKPNEEHIDLFFYYPVIVLQGELYESFYEKGNLIIEPKEHVQFRKQEIEKGEVETYQIDVITEGYLPEYLKLIRKEINFIKRRTKKNIIKINRSIKRIAKETIKSKSKEDLRNILMP